tara:strand:+ start:23524 stop:24177 length:654 start_codon:yes stop_codon:yes gene_type:complete
MANRMLMEPTKVHRLLKTLTYMGMVQQDKERRYLIGGGIQVLANLGFNGSELEWRRDKAIQLLSRDIKHNIAFGVMWEGMVTYLEGIQQSSKIVAGDGIDQISWDSLEEASTCCTGLVLLAGKNDEEVERIYRGRPIPGFIGGLGDLRRKLSEIQVRNYAYLTEVTRQRLGALAVPFTDGLSALEVRGPIVQGDFQRISEIVRQVILTVERSWRWNE